MENNREENIESEWLICVKSFKMYQESEYIGLHASERYEDGMKGRRCICVWVHLFKGSWSASDVLAG